MNENKKLKSQEFIYESWKKSQNEKCLVNKDIIKL